MDPTTFAVLGDPTRLRIVDALSQSAHCVNDLVHALDVPQPTISKHLRVLRNAGFVSVQSAAQQRIYYITPGPFLAIEGWLAPYQQLWNRHLDTLEDHLDRIDDRSHLEES